MGVEAAPPSLIGRKREWEWLVEFATTDKHPSALGIVWGNARVGKSFLLQSLAKKVDGVYYEAIRGSRADALRAAGELLGEAQQSVAPLALDSWEAVINACFALGRDRDLLVVFDELPLLLEHSPELESVLSRAFSPDNPNRAGSRTRLVVSGSAINVMANLLSSSGPLVGRIALDLRLAPLDFREARTLHDIADLATAVRTYAVIGGVPSYAREMSGGDLPKNANDFERWICRRVLSPSAPLFNESPYLFANDPTISQARKLNVYHAVLAGIATGRNTWSALTEELQIEGPALKPVMNALRAAGFVERIDDPVRDNRAIYEPVDQLLRFHYALLPRWIGRLSRHGADPHDAWRRMQSTFESSILAACFESMARYWTQHFASDETLDGVAAYVGTTSVSESPGRARFIPVIAADGAMSTPPQQRTVVAVGDAIFGSEVSDIDLHRLMDARALLGPKAATAKMLLFGTAFDPVVEEAAAERKDLELVSLERLYEGD